MLTELRAIAGEAYAREGAPADAVLGTGPAVVVTPGSAEEVGAVLRLATRSGWTVAVVGARTRVGWGNPPRRIDLLLSTERLNRLIEHSAGDLVVSAEAGMPLGRLQTQLAGAGQMLALDPTGDHSTLGGLIATNASGPRRLRYGTVRDLLIGITVALADGTLAKAGGKVVKNVAGYDLAKLFTGSLGTLGAITSATFRLHPLPAATRVLEMEVGSADDAGIAVQRVLGSTLVPSALEVFGGPDATLRLVLLFEGIEAGVEGQARAAGELLRGVGELTPLVAEDPLRAWRDLQSDALAGAGATLKISYLPTEFARTSASVRQAAERHGSEVRIHAHAGTGILHVGLTADAATAVTAELRTTIRPGSVVILNAPAELKLRMDAWGPIGDSLSLMRRVKAQFDPDGLLNPGRFVGGI